MVKLQNRTAENEASGSHATMPSMAIPGAEIWRFGF